MVRRKLDLYNVITFFVLFYQVNLIISECVDGTYHSKEGDCGAFYHCSNGELYEQRCPGELYFNPVLDVCDYPENVQCGGSVGPTTTRKSTIPSTTIPPTTTPSPPTTTLSPPTTTSSPPTTQEATTQTTSTEPSIQQALACEDSTLTIQCTPGQEIRVRDANYGRLSPTVCNEDGTKPTLDLNCLSGNSYDIVSGQCNEKESCSVPAKNAVFGDPCQNTYKYLTVDYECIL